MKNAKILQILLALLLVLFLTYGIYAVFSREKSPNIDNPKDDIEAIENNSEDTITPELEPEEETSSIGDIEMTIISPEGEMFETSQARMWEAKLDGVESEVSVRAECHWKFYLNEYNEEVLYKEMENSSIFSKDDPEVCTFTSTFIDKSGELRVVLDVEVQNAYREVVANYTAERKYLVD